MKVIAAFICGAAVVWFGIWGWLIWAFTRSNKIRYEEGEQ